jgi:hypothetical protein
MHMRLIKLSPKDPEMQTKDDVHKYFNDTLREQNPQGQLLLTKGRIAKKGIMPGELLN